MVNPPPLLFARVQRPCAFLPGALRTGAEGDPQSRDDARIPTAGLLAIRGLLLVGSVPGAGSQRAVAVSRGHVKARLVAEVRGRETALATDRAVCGRSCGPGRRPPARQ